MNILKLSGVRLLSLALLLGLVPLAYGRLVARAQPMPSAWPTASHDARHTGRRPRARQI